jgi:hypothetical protein
VYVSATERQPDRQALESLVRSRIANAGQAWSSSPEGRKAIETYAMGLSRSSPTGRRPHLEPAPPTADDRRAPSPIPYRD